MGCRDAGRLMAGWDWALGAKLPSFLSVPSPKGEENPKVWGCYFDSLGFGRDLGVGVGWARPPLPGQLEKLGVMGEPRNVVPGQPGSWYLL